MLEEIIKELTATNNDDHITSRGVLAWAKRVEAQRRQAAVLNTLELQLAGYCSSNHVSIVAEYTHLDNAQCMGRCVWDVARWDISRKYAAAKEVG